MRKIFLSAVAVTLIMPSMAKADEAWVLQQGLNDYLKAQSLSSLMPDVAAEVKVKDDLTVIFPQTEIENVGFDDEGNVKTSSEIIPSYEAVAKISGDFLNNPRYKISTDSIDALRSQAYTRFSLSGVSASSFNQNMYFVPALKALTGLNLNAQNIVLSSVDAKTNLKEEIASVSDVIMSSEISPSGNEANYTATWQIDNVNFKSPFVSVAVPRISSQINSVFKIDSTTDYNKLYADAAALKSSDSKVDLQNVSLDIMTGQKISYNLQALGKARLDEALNMLKVSGASYITDLKVTGMDDFPLREVKLKYLLKDIDVAKIKNIQSQAEKLLEISGSDDNDDLNEEQKQMVKQLGDEVEDLTKTMQLKLQANLIFDQADAALLVALKKSGRYVVGNGDITITDLEKLVPDYAKLCEEEMKQGNSMPESCMKAGMSAMLYEYIDTSKRTTNAKGQTVDKIEIVLNETGIYINNKKTAEPIEFDLNEMIAEMLTSSDSSGNSFDVSSDYEGL